MYTKKCLTQHSCASFEKKMCAECEKMLKQSIIECCYKHYMVKWLFWCVARYNILMNFFNSLMRFHIVILQGFILQSFSIFFLAFFSHRFKLGVFDEFERKYLVTTYTVTICPITELRTIDITVFLFIGQYQWI